MKVVFDANVVIDILGRTADFEDSFVAMDVALLRGYEACIAVSSTQAIQYVLVARKLMSSEQSRAALRRLQDAFTMLDVTPADFSEASRCSMADFEDALIAHAAYRNGADLIVTRNERDFKRSPVPALTPAAFVESYKPADYEHDLIDLPA